MVMSSVVGDTGICSKLGRQKVDATFNDDDNDNDCKNFFELQSYL